MKPPPHTPRPWLISPTAANLDGSEFIYSVEFPIEYGRTGSPVAAIWKGPHAAANARVVAAAPDMLAALRGADRIVRGIIAVGSEPGSDLREATDLMIGWWNRTAVPAILRARRRERIPRGFAHVY